MDPCCADTNLSSCNATRNSAYVTFSRQREVYLPFSQIVRCAYLDQSGSHLQSESWCSRRHKRCLPAAGTVQPSLHFLSLWHRCGSCHIYGCGPQHPACRLPPQCSTPGHHTLSLETSLQRGWKSNRMRSWGLHGSSPERKQWHNGSTINYQNCTSFAFTQTEIIQEIQERTERDDKHNVIQGGFVFSKWCMDTSKRGILTSPTILLDMN